MKTCLTLSFIFLYIIAYSQKNKDNVTPSLPMDSSTHKITYAEVVKVDTSLSKVELYSRAREWFAKTYVSAKDVLQMEDKNEGKIVGRALFDVTIRSFGKDRPAGGINYTITIQTKDGRYRYEITDFYHKSDFYNYGACERFYNSEEKRNGVNQKKFYDSFLQQIDDHAKLIIRVHFQKTWPNWYAHSFNSPLTRLGKWSQSPFGRGYFCKLRVV